MVLIPGQQAPLGEQIDGGLKDIETPVCSEVMETVPRIAALHVQAECLAYTVGTPLMRMAKNAVFILSGEHGVVIIGVLIERSCSGKVGDDRPVDLATLHEIRIDPAHILVGRGQDKGLGRLRLFLFGRWVYLPLLSAQQHGHRLREGEAVVFLHEVDGPAALAFGVVKPLSPPDGNALVRSQSLVPSGGNELFPTAAQELFQVHLVGPMLLRFCKINKGSHNRFTSIFCCLLTENHVK